MLIRDMPLMVGELIAAELCGYLRGGAANRCQEIWVKKPGRGRF
jgi:hypothetical protein